VITDMRQVLWQHGSTRCKAPHGAYGAQTMTENIIALAKQYDRYDCGWVTALLCHAEWTVSHKRVERIWQRERLDVPQRQPKRKRLWLNNGTCNRLRLEYPEHV